MILLKTSSLLLLIGVSLCQDPGPPTWADGSRLTITPMGLGNLLLTWPVAENNVYDIIGYKVFMSDASAASEEMILLFDGTGLVAIRQYLVLDLVPGQTYSFYIQALNTDPGKTVVLTSNYLFRTFTLAEPVGLDPTTLGQTSLTVRAGETIVLPIQGLQPSTGNPQDIGPVCSVAALASCVPGRTFIAIIEPFCELVDLNSRCKLVNELSPNGFNTNTLPYIQDYKSSISVAYDERNDGNYKIEITGDRSGLFTLGLKAVTPGQLLGLYWNNPSFFGTPMDTRTDAIIDFEWASGSLLAWASEYVSVRWSGFIRTESSGLYTFACRANTRCDVWVEEEPIVVANGTSCYTRCESERPLELRRSHYYRLRVDYVTATGDSFISLEWKETKNGVYPQYVPVPSSVLARGAYMSQAPLTLTVLPGKMAGPRSYVYGSEEAMFRPMAGKLYTLFIQVKDAFGNPCSAFDSSDLVTVEGQGKSNFKIIAQPYNESVGDCVFAARVGHKQVGSVRLAVSVNGESVYNSPLFQTVSPGVFDPTRVPLNMVSFSLTEMTVNTTFNVSIVPTDVFGNPVGANLRTTDLRFKLERDKDIVISSENTCGTRSDVVWSIFCFGSEFMYIDDSLLVGNQFPPFMSGGDVEIDSEGYIQLRRLKSFYSGPHSLHVFVGESIVTGSPIPITFVPGSNDLVEPVMSLVQFDTPADDATSAVLYETDINATVLLRDKAGNVLYDRADIDVKIHVGSREDACSYVPNKYYQCSSFADQEGRNEVYVTVNGEIASNVQGGLPPGEECRRIAFCGTDACPCYQQRVPARRVLDVISI